MRAACGQRHVALPLCATCLDPFVRLTVPTVRCNTDNKKRLGSKRRQLQGEMGGGGVGGEGWRVGDALGARFMGSRGSIGWTWRRRPPRSTWPRSSC